MQKFIVPIGGKQWLPKTNCSLLDTYRNYVKFNEVNSPFIARVLPVIHV